MSISVPPRYAPPAPIKAGPVGSGAGVLNTEYPLSAIGGRDSAQKRMKRAWTMSFEVPWIAAAEDAVSERFSGVAWHLEDENDELIDDQYPNPNAQAARLLIEKPSTGVSDGAPYYRSDLWALTSRAMGICGSAFIFLDQPERLAGTPTAMLPIAPWRMFAEEDTQGNLVGWSIDKTQTNPGIPVRLDQVLHYQLRRNFTGHFGIGLMESAMRKITISQGLDDHLALVLSAGGRLSGIMSPTSGVIGDDVMLQMERDWRTIVEQSDAAKRLQLVRAPVKFDRTTLTPDELQVRDLMIGARDDLLALWGVPLSIIGGATPAGLNSGETRKYDEAAIWQGPVHHRLNIFSEVTQYQLLDRYANRGAVVELEIDEPEFDDDSPRYDLLAKSVSTPMRNAERRALINLEPFGDPALDNQVVLPATMVVFADAPDVDTGKVTVSAPGYDAQSDPVETNDRAAAAAGEVSAQESKAEPIHPRVVGLHNSLTRYRTHAQAKYTPLLKSAVNDVLHAQRADIVARMRKNAAHIAKDPADTSAWFARGWDEKLHKALAPRLEAVAHVVNAQINDVLPAKTQYAKAAPVGAVERVMTRGAARVTGINDHTRTKIQSAIARGLERGLSVLDVADLIESDEAPAAEAIGLDLTSLFSDYRAEMIARTELMDAYNATAIASYSDAGVEQVQAIDGDDDLECSERDGETYPVDEADSIEDHPNGTLDWVPVIGDEGKAFTIVRPPAPAIVHNHFTVAASPTPNVEVHPTQVTVEAAQVNVPAPVVNVAAPDPTPVVVNVPEAKAPVIEVNTPQPQVNVSLPATMHIASMPDRITRTTVNRDAHGQVTETKMTESDG